jgi:hypothetical protein
MGCSGPEVITFLANHQAQWGTEPVLLTSRLLPVRMGCSGPEVITFGDNYISGELSTD